MSADSSYITDSETKIAVAKVLGLSTTGLKSFDIKFEGQGMVLVYACYMANGDAIRHLAKFKKL